MRFLTVIIFHEGEFCWKHSNQEKGFKHEQDSDRALLVISLCTVGAVLLKALVEL